VVPASTAYTFTTAGTYNWQAVYSGDANNAGASSPCGAETIKVAKNTPTVATQPKNASTNANIADDSPVEPDSKIYDTAVLTGATANAGGSVTFNLYAGTACTGTPIFTSTVTVTNGVVPASTAYTFTTAGTYNWQAVYSGDANNAGASSPCGAETIIRPAGIMSLTPGYWRNHPDLLRTYLPVILGDYRVDTVTKATTIFDTMNCSSTTTQDAVGCLAGHSLAAKLNVANKASTCISPTVTEADSFLRSVKYTGPSGTYRLTTTQRSTAVRIKDALDLYNNNVGCNKTTTTAGLTNPGQVTFAVALKLAVPREAEKSRPFLPFHFRQGYRIAA
jgi:hypothetical protein